MHPREKTMPKVFMKGVKVKVIQYGSPAPSTVRWADLYGRIVQTMRTWSRAA